MSLAAGSRLGPYEIVSPLGAGGMGEVWKARDTRLDRFVAVKVLPEHLAKDAELLARFEREAKALAALDHPGLLAVHDFAREGDVAYAVMELLEGESLRTRLGEGPIPARKAIDLAVQMARALAAAHEKGILHRDLKPENLWVTKDGRLKILDFGLAKQLFGPDVPADSQSPTRGIPAGEALSTEKGMVLGTAGYMSPEQVRGESVDARSDLFSFGAVLFEMLTGRRAFARASATETYAAILRDEPPALEAGSRPIPAGLERIVHHCLEKRADQRFRSAHDVAFALENLATGGENQAPIERRRRTIPWRWAGLVALVAAAAATAGWLARGGPPPEPTFHRLTFQQGTVENARFGPDGKSVLYSARWKGGPPTVYSIPPGSLEPQQLNVGSSTLLAVSPENELAVLLSPLLTYGLYPGKLARVPAAGGGAREIEPNVLAADWNPRSGELAAVSVLRANWQLESPPGKVLRAGPGIDFPRFSRRDGSLAFFENAVGLSWPLLPASGDVVVLDPAGKSSVIAAGRHCTGLAWSPAGDEIWFTEWSDGRRTTLYAASLSGKLRTIWSGPGNLALQDVSVDGRALILTRQVQDGVLVLEEGQTRERDVSIFDGTVAIDFTPDRRALLVNERGGGGGPGGSVFLTPLDGGLPVKLSKGEAEALSPDGKQVLLTNAGRPGRFTLVPTGSGTPTEFEVEGVRSNQLAKFLPDGRQVVFQGTNGDRPIRLYVAEVGKSEAPRPITPEGTLVWKGANQVSPDGRSILFFRDSVDGGTDEVLSLADGSISTVPGREARDIPIRWTEDGRGIYVFKREGLPVRISRLDLATGTKSLVKEFMPADPGGISGMSSVTMTADARLYAFNYRRRISELFLVEGLR